MTTAKRKSTARVLRPGRGTLAALSCVCPHCSAKQGVRCTTPSGEPLQFVHSKRMNLVRDAVAKLIWRAS